MTRIIKYKVAIDTILTFSGMLLFQATNFIVGIIIARFASVSDLGAFQFFIVTTSFFAFFAKIGVDEKLTYVLPYLGGIKQEASKELIFNLFTKVIKYSFLSALGTILFYKMMSVFSIIKIEIPESFFSIVYLPALACGTIIGSIFRSESLIKVRAFLIYFIPSITTVLILGSIVLLFGLNKYNILLMRSSTYVLVLITGIHLLKKHLNYNILSVVKKNRLESNQVYDKTLYKWLFITLITFLIETGTLGLWLVRLTSDNYDIGVITIMLRLAALTYLAPTAISIVVAPIIATKFSKGLSVSGIKLKTMSLAFILVLSVSLFVRLFSSNILGLFGKDLIGYSSELNYMLVGASMVALTQPLQSIALATIGFKKVFVVSILGGIISICSFYFFDYQDSILMSVKAISSSMVIFGFTRMIYLFISR